MRRPVLIGWMFGISVLLVGVTMVWISSMALRLERTTAEVTARADHEEKIRLALWRMDSIITPLIVEESSRPFFLYQPFYLTRRAYDRLFSELEPGEVLVPSPLLSFTPENIRLHFQMDSEGQLTSPQVPTGTMRDRAEQDYVRRERVEAAGAHLEELEKLLDRESLLAAIPEARNQFELQVSNAQGAWTADELPTQYKLTPPRQQLQEPAQVQKRSAQLSQSFEAIKQSARGSNEYNARKRAVNRLASQQVDNLSNQLMFCKTYIPEESFIENAMLPMWVKGELILARRVNLQGQDIIQGCWINWPELRQKLLQETRELLPESGLEPVLDPEGELPDRMLASLPVEFRAGPAPPVEVEPLLSVRLPLIVGWGCGGLAVVAIGILLAGVVRLSERRASFVSAVTHELRTPLTTFKMYTDMLLGGRVRGEEQRQKYLETLQTEADRLGHMVENVLAYARLENRGESQALETVSVGALLDRVESRLADRATQSGIELRVDPGETDDGSRPRELTVRVEPSTVEQILLNLVDNACKYGRGSGQESIHLELRVGQRPSDPVELRVRDHGPGLERDALRKLFEPFSKSASEAARSAPGVGLGLALSRDLARAMGGDLRLVETSPTGTVFSLALPRG